MDLQTIDNLPAVKSAKLPTAYESAKTALAKCVRIDECKKWADKAMALSSYARQVEDTTLENHAIRIKARAIRRMGQLLESINPSTGGGNSTGGAAHPSARKNAASEAGMSLHQQKQAQRVARIPKDNFNAQVESDNPPTVSKLAKQGRKPLPFTKKQVTKAKARISLQMVFKAIEELDNDFEWDDFVALADAADAIDLTNRCRNAARIFEQIARCIAKKT